MAQSSLSVIPNPLKADVGCEKFRIADSINVLIDPSFNLNEAQSILSIYKVLNGLFFNDVRYHIYNRNDEKADEGDIIMKNNFSLPEEGYKLSVSRKGIVIEASSEVGLFYAFQTLFLSASPEDKSCIPFMEVADQSRFEYRGFMLDVSRYFLPKEDVLKIIDCMSLLKLNKLHLHLTDDNGWRIEIKKYPALTSIGAWRVNRNNLAFPDRRNSVKGEPTPIGGFYTQEDIKEIVNYAQQRYVEIIPEIDMPGHSNAALTAYPELACPSVDKQIGVVPGMGQGSGNIILCAGNEKS